MEITNLIPHIEALIFASDKPLTTLEVTDLVNNALGFMDDKITLDQVESSLEGITEKYSAEFYPFEVRQSGGGWQFGPALAAASIGCFSRTCSGSIVDQNAAREMGSTTLRKASRRAVAQASNSDSGAPRRKCDSKTEARDAASRMPEARPKTAKGFVTVFGREHQHKVQTTMA